MYGTTNGPFSDEEVNSMPLRTQPLQRPRRKELAPRWASVALVCTAVVVATVLVLSSSKVGRHAKVASEEGRGRGRRRASLYKRWGKSYSSQTEDVALAFEVKNRYGKHTEMVTEYPWLKGKKLIEPHMETVLRILQPYEGVTYVWEILHEDMRVNQYVGSAVNVMLEQPGKYTVHVRARDDNKNVLSRASEEVYCKYVRRELRSLLPEDRDAFFDAAATIWRTTTDDGQLLYGPDYNDIHFFAGYHLLMAAEEHCDHMHDGLGFMTQHAALTIKFEQVLRSINPALSVPYWDYTIDTEYIYAHKDGNYSQYWFEAEPFSDDFFGRVDPDEHTVTTGRWAYTEITKSTFDIKNPYGLMRAPWNCNKSKYVTRYSTFCGQEWSSSNYVMPNCRIHYNAIAGYNTWESFGTSLSQQPHGAIHSATGGTFNCDASRAAMKDLGLDDEFVMFYSLWSFGYQRKFWRQGVLKCPTDCSDETPQSECICTCDVDDLVSRYKSMDDLLRELVNDPDYRSKVTALDEDSQREFVGLVCQSGVLVGDQIEAASPYDISFWPMHPTLERVYMAKKLWGMFTDETWSDGSSMYGTECGGHDVNNTLPIVGLTADPDAYLTNGELLSLMDPAQDGLPYVYDDFAWAHCKDLGIDFRNMTLGVVIGEVQPEGHSDTPKRRRLA